VSVLKNVKKKLKLLIIFSFLLVILPLISGVTFGPDTTLNSSSSNSSFTFTTCTLEADRITITPVSIEVFNASRTATIEFDFPGFFNHTEINTNYNCEEIGVKFGADPTVNSCFSILTAQLSFFETIGTVFSIMALVIIVSLLILILAAFSIGKTKELGSFFINMQFKDYSAIMMLIGIMGFISIIFITIGSLMCPFV